jgi:hypothetical protein
MKFHRRYVRLSYLFARLLVEQTHMLHSWGPLPAFGRTDAARRPLREGGGAGGQPHSTVQPAAESKARFRGNHFALALCFQASLRFLASLSWRLCDSCRFRQIAKRPRQGDATAPLAETPLQACWRTLTGRGGEGGGICPGA